MRYYFILFFILIKSFSAYSQLGWEPWEIIYSDSTVTVEVQFRLSDNSCELDGKKFKFRTRIKGELKTYNYFVNWKMNYTDCNGSQFYQQNSVPIWKLGGGISDEIPIESIDDIFTASSLDSMHYDVEVDYYPKTGTGRRGVFKSIAPKSIIGKNKINYKESVVLSVNGGQLGEAAEWVWYKDTCGSNKIGTGSSIKVQPDATSVYFVRAEGRDNITNCAQLTVIVNQNSREPESIILKSPACKGVPNTLKVNGGFLGLEAVWKWYEDSCNGNFIGTGNYITINPTQRTTYFVRAEGKSNITRCAKLLVVPMDKSLDPISSVISKRIIVCEGDSVELSIPDKGLSPDAHWSWSKDYCGDYSLATGPVFTVKPDSTTTYFVRGEGECYNTKCASITIHVDEKSVGPDKIITWPDSAKILKRKKAVLTVVGGELGKDAEWNWYKGSCKGKFISHGDSIVIHPRKKATYYVKAKGLCNTTECKGIVISPTKYHYFSKQYSRKMRNAYHIGLGLGIENFEYDNLMNFTKKDSSGNVLAKDTSTNFVNGSGLKIDLMYHPILNRFLSFGLFGSYAQGTTTLFILGNKSSDLLTSTEIRYKYETKSYGAELAFGFKKIKALGVYYRSKQTNDYIKTVTSKSSVKEYVYDQDFYKEMISLGLRFGSYTGSKKVKRPHNFDVVYNLNRNITNRFLQYSFKDYKDLSDWNIGLGLQFWVQSKVRMKLDVMSATSHRDLKLINLGSLQYMASISMNMDRFRKYK